MCLGVPMELVELVDEERGVAELDGVRCEVSLPLIEEPKVGDYLIVHAGFAIERLDRDEADARIDLFRQLGEMQRHENSATTEPVT